ncbi:MULTISPECIES: hypothetical protein [Clostridium]|uniref:Uncharacterized protein n=1 Tax=Clostridium novyi B str. ATCC 27606 TaxID=1443123 RepID=A0AA40IRK9_CLONO|nr:MULTISPECIES: hypothetical protein [Clostridium]KEI08165.1 hypothetical protein Z958_p0045 [Clostridium novyi B str. NCTC 9691]KEI11504.1 hypothetical protein Z959_p0070 [Clostridium novyi B str. ATCC 27606]KLU74273.1 hypothetical protein CBC3_p0274 [Clostridium botulinum V891]
MLDNLELADIEINYNIKDSNSIIGKIKIDGIDYSNKVASIESSFDAENRIPIVKVAFYCDTLKINGKAKVDIDESRNKTKANR